jgi:predicted lipoprotein
MPASTPSAPRRLPPWPVIAGVVVVIGVLVIFPPFRVVSTTTAPGHPGGAPVASAAFDAVAFAGQFWTGQLQPAAAGAAELPPILAALRQDAAAAAKAHGRQVGLGGPVYFFARASGPVVAVERGRVLVAVDGAGGATVALRTGPVFGNTVRDGCGLLEVNSVPGLQEFNAISAELNRLVEERVQPALKSGLAVGARIAFAGCAEAPERVGDGPVLNFIPVQAEVKP